MKKKMLCSAISLTIVVFASAQTTSNSRNPGKNVSPSHPAVRTVGQKSASATTVPSDNRKEYVKDGQRATATGHQATAINSDEYQSPRDSPGKKKKKQ